jgi:competence protein ComEA
MSSVMLKKVPMLGLLIGAIATTAFTLPMQVYAQAPSPAEVAVEQVNINAADAETIADVLVGVGDSKAKAIVEFREQNGPFTSVDQLTEVNGIGDSILSQNRERITLE